MENIKLEKLISVTNELKEKENSYYEKIRQADVTRASLSGLENEINELYETAAELALSLQNEGVKHELIIEYLY